jgi:hypothetical protein
MIQKFSKTNLIFHFEVIHRNGNHRFFHSKRLIDPLNN